MVRGTRCIPQSSNLNAFVERFGQADQQEVPDNFAVLGERHQNRIVSELIHNYYNLRPHLSQENRPPGVDQQPEEVMSFDSDALDFKP